MNEPSDGLGDLNPRQLREMVRRYKTRAANSEAALAAAEQKVADADTVWLNFSDEDVAKLFHSTYEDLAPTYGYTTRKASAVLWQDVPEQNRLLMVETVTRVRLEMVDAFKAAHEATE